MDFVPIARGNHMEQTDTASHTFTLGPVNYAAYMNATLPHRTSGPQTKGNNPESGPLNLPS